MLIFKYDTMIFPPDSCPLIYLFIYLFRLETDHFTIGWEH